MKNKSLDAKQRVRRFEFGDGGSIERRRTEILSARTCFFEDVFDGEGAFEGKIITCSGWLLELYELDAGEIFFKSGEREIRPATARFGIFYAPFSLTHLCFKNANGKVFGVAGDEALAAKFLRAPFIFETTFSGKPSGAEEVEKILNSGTNASPVEANPHASLLSLKTKKLIDENYHVYPSIARIAARLKVSHEHLSRQFKHDFGMTPSAYLREIRVSDATFRLARGEEIINVSGDVGYNDLSRFYKQFRQTTKTSPGVCQKQISQIFSEK